MTSQQILRIPNPATGIETEWVPKAECDRLFVFPSCMTLRDWFAAHAMPLVCELVSPSIGNAIDEACAADNIDPSEIDQEARAAIAFELLSRRCYEFADAMLIEKRRPPAD